MPTTTERQLCEFLKLYHVSLSEKMVGGRLRNHPLYPSIASIEDALDSFGVQVICLTLTREDITNIGSCFLAQVPGATNTGFTVVKDRNDFLDDEELTEKWNGNVVLVKSLDRRLINPEVSVQLRLGRLRKAGNLLFVSLATAACIVYLIAQFSLFSILLLLTNVVGAAIGALLLRKESGMSGGEFDKLCKLKDNWDCDAVLHSKGSKLLGMVKLSDLVVVYFSWNLLSQLASAIYPAVQIGIYGWFSLTAFGSIPLIFYSVIYQVVKLHKFCIFCIMANVSLIGQLFLLSPWFPGHHLSVLIWAGVPVGILLLAAVSCLVVAKVYYQEKMIARTNEYVSRSFKRQADLFLALLLKQPAIDPSSIDGELLLGNPDAPLKFILVSSFQCSHCLMVQRELKRALDKYEMEILLSIRFILEQEDADPSPMRTTLATILGNIARLENFGSDCNENSHLARAIREAANQRMEMLEYWYLHKDYKRFSTMYPLVGDQSAGLRSCRQWLNGISIRTVPELFINGYRLPDPYAISDLPFFLPVLIQHFSSTG